MVNILIWLILFIIFKLLVIIGYGYYSFRHVERPDCYASADNERPSSRKEDGSYENVTFQYMLILQIGFWVAVFQAILLLPSIANKTVQKILLFTLIPDFALFIWLNVLLLRSPSQTCNGDALSDDDKASVNYLPREENEFLYYSLIIQWILVGYLIILIGCVHTCFTFCFRV